jgi:hypothetical protein
MVHRRRGRRWLRWPPTPTDAHMCRGKQGSGYAGPLLPVRTPIRFPQTHTLNHATSSSPDTVTCAPVTHTSTTLPPPPPIPRHWDVCTCDPLLNHHPPRTPTHLSLSPTPTHYRCLPPPLPAVLAARWVWGLSAPGVRFTHGKASQHRFLHATTCCECEARSPFHCVSVAQHVPHCAPLSSCL